MMRIGIVGFLLLCCFVEPLFARNPFNLTLFVEGQKEAEATFTDVDAFLDSLTTSNLNDLANQYNENSAAVLLADIRGLDARVDFKANNPAVFLSIPCLGLLEMQFDGLTRDHSVRAMEDWLKGEENNLHSQLMGCLVRHSAIDPVFGNPASLSAMMLDHDFDQGMESDDRVSEEEKRARVNRVFTNASYGKYAVDNFNTTVYRMPWSYHYRLESPRNTLIFSLPITYIDSSGADVYNISMGLGLRHRNNDYWQITPAFAMGVAGSQDLGSGSVVSSLSLTNKLFYFKGDLDLFFGNLLGRYRSHSVEYRGVKFSYLIESNVMRNGLGAEGDLWFTVFGRSSSWQVMFTETRYYGDKLFMKRYHDLVLTLGTRTSEQQVAWQRLRFGVTLTRGDQQFSGYRVNFGYDF